MTLTASSTSTATASATPATPFMETVMAEATQTAGASFLTATAVSLTESPVPFTPAFAGGLSFDFSTPTATPSSTPVADEDLQNVPVTGAPAGWFGVPNWIAFYFLCGFGFIVIAGIVYFSFVLFRVDRKR
jgi:hypothetical protein